jgi:hypothetical protein
LAAARGVSCVKCGLEEDCYLPGSEGAGDGEEDNFLVCPLFAGVVGLGTAAGGRVSVGNGSPSVMVVLDLCNAVELGGVLLNLLELDAFGQGVSNFERGHDDWFCCECVD